MAAMWGSHFQLLCITLTLQTKAPRKKKPRASIADASYEAHIAHLHLVATLLGAGLDCLLHSEVSCAGNIPQRF